MDQALPTLRECCFLQGVVAQGLLDVGEHVAGYVALEAAFDVAWAQALGGSAFDVGAGGCVVLVSERNRCGLSAAVISSCAALTGPTPG
ncbi:hypothetical protein GCM10027087_65520 [Paractinoplanes abujensis]|uniref:Uncharacterized protein n=1 Tax=Paractinoplanes abujensis TaxID=882441 RepID=A0A7W7G6S8_9ACTN|nr:hypothetical protein [Actinoplanes abujensis]MBB4698377.1 hypothetical protein [Actinoplanes abujensis]